MKQYLDLLQKIMNEGVDKEDRTGVGIRELFGAQLEFDLQKGFPLVTTKKMFIKGIIHELLWFLNGDTNIKYLNDNGVHIWDAWADKDGNLGPIYGKQWTSWNRFEIYDHKLQYAYLADEIDQIENAIRLIKENANDRGIIVTAWNPAELNKMKLRPCHCLFQFNVQNGKLNCQLYQRSADMFLGVPFNIASYALLTMMISKVCDLEPGKFVHTFGSAHIYHNHFDQVNEQLKREPYELPRMEITDEPRWISSFLYNDFKLIDYKSHSTIKADIAI